MKPLIIGVLLLHLTLVVLCFGTAIYQPERSGLLPVLVYYADYPASLLAEPLRRVLHDNGGFRSYAGRLVADALVFILVGSVWWLLLGLLVRRLVRAFVARAS